MKGNEKTKFAGGGGFGDAVFLWNKFCKMAEAGSSLRFYTAQPSAERLAHAFFVAQGCDVGVIRVPCIRDAIRSERRRGARILNTTWCGLNVLQPWLWRCYPYDTVVSPELSFRVDPWEAEQPYFVVQTNAGTMKYASGKNWCETGWINSLIDSLKATGRECVLTGTENPGIEGADREALNLPMDQLLGLIQGAAFVVGLQGFITITALMMRKPVLLKRENLLVTFNHIHPAWRRHLKVFSEPVRPGDRRFRRLVAFAMKHAGASIR